MSSWAVEDALDPALGAGIELSGLYGLDDGNSQHRMEKLPQWLAKVLPINYGTSLMKALRGLERHPCVGGIPLVNPFRRLDLELVVHVSDDEPAFAYPDADHKVSLESKIGTGGVRHVVELHDEAVCGHISAQPTFEPGALSR